jgi:hypothetical protein
MTKKIEILADKYNADCYCREVHRKMLPNIFGIMIVVLQYFNVSLNQSPSQPTKKKKSYEYCYCFLSRVLEADVSVLGDYAVFVF